MPRRATPLSAQKVLKAGPGRYYDGDGLLLLVKDQDRAWWVYRFTIAGRTRELGLGRARGPNAVSLAEARAKAKAHREKVREGTDPLAERAAEERREAERATATAKVMTFGEVVNHYIAAHELGWGAKHAQQWRNTMRDHVLPTIGDASVAEVDTGAVMRVLEPIWRERTETASRVRGRIEAVLDYARARNWRSGENPARWKGHIKNLLPARGRVRAVEHHPALPWPDIGAFMMALRAQDGIGAKALEFAILTGARSAEVRGARWTEIDLASGIWTVPGSRMKAGREHRVPLSEPALAILRTMAPLRASPDALIFPGRKSQPLSDMSLIAVLRRMGRSDWTVHGFRSSFRDWAGQTTAYPREVIEMALAHRLGDVVEQSYARGDLFQKRRRLMEDWSVFCGRPAPAAGEVVVHLRERVAG